MANVAACEAGGEIGKEAAQHSRYRKEMLSDEERRLKAEPLIDTGKTQIADLRELEKAGLKDSQQYKDLHQSHVNTQAAFNELYDHIKAPGAIQQDVHWLIEKIHGIKQPKGAQPPVSTTPQTPATTPNTPVAPPPSISDPSVTLSDPSEQAAWQAQAANPVWPSGVPMKGATARPPTTTQNAVPKGATQFMAVAKPVGLVESGNIPIWNRPSILNDDGTHSSELSISVGDDKGNEVLIPLIADGKFLTPNGKMPPGPIPHNAKEWESASPEWKALKMEAWKHYEQTGQHLGKFGGPNAADDTDAYAQILHNRGNSTSSAATPAPPPGTSAPVTPPAGPPVTAAKAPAAPPLATAAKAPLSWANRGQYQSPKEIRQKAVAMQKAQQEATLLEAGAGLSQEQIATVNARGAAAAKEVEADSAIKLFDHLFPDATKEDKDKFKNTVVETMLGAKTSSLAGKWDRVPGKINGQAVTLLYNEKTGDYKYATGESVPSDLVGNFTADPKPTKAVRGTLMNTKQHGFIQTWVNPFTLKVMGWQPITPSRYYQGMMSTGSTTDAFGVTTSSTHLTKPTNTTPVDFDFSGTEKLSNDFNGTDDSGNPSPAGQTPTSAVPTPVGAAPASVSKPEVTPTSPSRPKRAATPSELKSQIPAPPSTSATSQFQVDAAGHIPDADTSRYRLNPNLVQIANNIIDGQDISKIGLKDRGAAEQLAMKYGWKGQGLFTPRESLQIKEGASFLSKMANSPSLKVLDNGFFSNLPMVGASPDPAKEGFFGRMTTNLSSRNQSPEQQEFMDLYRQLDAMAIGLRALVQAGRGTQKQTDLLIAELPNPYNTPSSKDAKRRLQLVKNELDIAAKTGKLPEVEQMTKDFGDKSSGNTGTNPSGGLTADQFRQKHMGN
jgi:hypothetical protein